jgi:ubiquinone/menaquinone biosynthesis C-methylase UbiE
MRKTKGVKEYFDKTDDYIKANPVIQVRKKIIGEIVGNLKDKQIIDVGCGNGELTREFVFGNRITFLDISDKMLDLARLNISEEHLNHASFVNSDILSFKTEKTFDLVVCTGVVAHVENIQGLLNKLKEIVKDDGMILLQFSASEKLISKFNQLRNGLFRKARSNYNYKINLTSSSFIEKLLNNCGLIIIKKVKYLPVSPLFSIFNYKSRIKFMEASYKNRLLSYFGSEIILSLSKAPKTQELL